MTIVNSTEHVGWLLSHVERQVSPEVLLHFSRLTHHLLTAPSLQLHQCRWAPLSLLPSSLLFSLFSCFFFLLFFLWFSLFFQFFHFCSFSFFSLSFIFSFISFFILLSLLFCFSLGEGDALYVLVFMCMSVCLYIPSFSVCICDLVKCDRQYCSYESGMSLSTLVLHCGAFFSLDGEETLDIFTNIYEVLLQNGVSVIYDEAMQSTVYFP